MRHIYGIMAVALFLAACGGSGNTVQAFVQFTANNTITT